MLQSPNSSPQCYPFFLFNLSPISLSLSPKSYMLQSPTSIHFLPSSLLYHPFHSLCVCVTLCGMIDLRLFSSVVLEEAMTLSRHAGAGPSTLIPPYPSPCTHAAPLDVTSCASPLVGLPDDVSSGRQQCAHHGCHAHQQHTTTKEYSSHAGCFHYRHGPNMACCYSGHTVTVAKATHDVSGLQR
jgi:hypothetical protein